MIGRRLRELRKARGLTQQQVAAYLNAAKSTVSQYENDINEPDLETLVKLADWFGVSVDELLGRTGYPSEKPAYAHSELIHEKLSDDEEDYLRDSLEMYRKWKRKQETKD